jgi:hypothetical protein
MLTFPPLNKILPWLRAQPILVLNCFTQTVESGSTCENRSWTATGRAAIAAAASMASTKGNHP